MNLLRILPKNILSQLVGRAVAIEQPRLLAHKVRDWFVERYHVDMNEAEFEIEQYPTLAKLFTRKLKPGLRPIGHGLVHPCDGALTCAEHIDGDSILQVKGRTYSLMQLLAGSLDASDTSVFYGGTHLVYYLCPTDYHRVHAPVDGEIVSVTHVPGALWPVNNWSVKNIGDLFAVNERVIFNFKTALGPVALVMVGATNVGQITVSFDSTIVSNTPASSSDFPCASPRVKKYDKPIRISKGEEIGIFNMGSTVVMLYGPSMVNVLPPLGQVRFGASL